MQKNRGCMPVHFALSDVLHCLRQRSSSRNPCRRPSPAIVMADLAARCPPPAPTHPLWQFQPTSFRIDAGRFADPRAYLEWTRHCLERLSKSCKIIQFKPSSLKLALRPRAGGPFLLKIKLYTVDAERASWVVEFHKRRGCSVAFHHLFNAFLRRSIRSRC